jgi:hypothetical protein
MLSNAVIDAHKNYNDSGNDYCQRRRVRPSPINGPAASAARVAPARRSVEKNHKITALENHLKKPISLPVPAIGHIRGVLRHCRRYRKRPHSWRQLRRPVVQPSGSTGMVSQGSHAPAYERQMNASEFYHCASLLLSRVGYVIDVAEATFKFPDGVLPA